MSRDGATLLTAFDINQAYKASRDAHVTAPVYFMNGGAALVNFAIIDPEGVPGQYLSLTETDGKVSVVLKSVSKGDNGRDVVSIVKTIEQIDGRDALEYLQWFVDLPGNMVSDCGDFKSPGSRMQSLLGAGNGGQVVANIQLGNVFDDLPDSVPITYSDGSIGTWLYTVLAAGWEDYTEAEMTQAANTIPEDGPYAIFETALDQATASVSEKRKRESAVLSAVPDFPKAKRADRGQKRASVVYSRPEQDGEMVYTNITISGVDDYGRVFNQVFYITHVGNATVLRFKSFDMMGDFEKLVEVYNYIFDYGKKHSTLQLIIDLTDNGGGTVQQAYLMTQLLYPQVTYPQLLLPYQARLSPVVQQSQKLQKDVQEAFNIITGSETVVRNVSQILKSDISGTVVTLKRMRNVLKAKILLSTDGQLKDDPCSQYIDGIWTLCSNLRTLSSIIERVRKTKHIRSSDVLTILNMSLQVDTEINPVKMVGGTTPGSLSNSVSVATVIQGGLETTVATNWTNLGAPFFVYGQSLASKLSTNPFTQYTVVGNGLGGSSSSLFADNILQTSMANPTWTKAVSVCYGGNGDPKDCVLNQYQGGTVSKNAARAKDIQLDAADHVFTALFANTLVSASGSSLDAGYVGALKQYVDKVNAYLDAVPQPPMTATGTYTNAQLTIVAVLPKAIGWDTIPSEYFGDPADRYVPYWHPPGDYDSRDMSGLYSLLVAN